MSTNTTFPKLRLFGIDFDVLTMHDAVDWVFRSVAMGKQKATRFVVTPNVSITLQHQSNPELRKAVASAALTIVDGTPLVGYSRLSNKRLPERVAGSDLVYATFDAAITEIPLRVFLLGAAPGVAERATERIHSQWDAVQVVGSCSPPPGFESEEAINSEILRLVGSAQPDVLIIGLGAPRQEQWAFQHRRQIEAAVTFCVGGTIDFLAGEQTRAPEWIRKSGVEWLWRMATNPKRLFSRYAGDAIRLPGLVFSELCGRCPTCCSNTRPRDRQLAGNDALSIRKSQ